MSSSASVCLVSDASICLAVLRGLVLNPFLGTAFFFWGDLDSDLDGGAGFAPRLGAGFGGVFLGVVFFLLLVFPPLKVSHNQWFFGLLRGLEAGDVRGDCYLLRFVESSGPFLSGGSPRRFHPQCNSYILIFFIYVILP